ncbi:uncharacterized protein LOC130046615 [Ostrea edulis]|uniref:uncharacterized protein LOC130046615 n=1 Tax=Ostrea edulis TaxID=37623 RepID=UPI0024AF1E73|nr:uncharacterized protein LOC130046615 [Ostrea edulis]
MIVYFVFFVSFQHDWSIAQKGGCSDNKNGCCAETVWNEALGKCTECMSGYIGQYCNETCEYPRYGRRCMRKCDCEQDRCNFMIGCPNYESSTTLKQSSFIYRERQTSAGAYARISSK